MQQNYSISLVMRLSNEGITSSLATPEIFLFANTSICLMSEKPSERKVSFSITFYK